MCVLKQHLSRSAKRSLLPNNPLTRKLEGTCIHPTRLRLLEVTFSLPSVHALFPSRSSNGASTPGHQATHVTYTSMNTVRSSCANEMSSSDPLYYISDSTIGGQAAGKGFFSSRDISAGEPIVTVQHPLMLSLESERLRDTCANCYVWTEGASLGSRLYVKEGTSVSACAGCRRFRYCSKVRLRSTKRNPAEDSRHVKKQHGLVVTNMSAKISSCKRTKHSPKPYWDAWRYWCVGNTAS